MNAPDKAKEIRGVVAAAIGFLTALWGWAGWAVLVWAALILIDYGTTGKELVVGDCQGWAVA